LLDSEFERNGRDGHGERGGVISPDGRTAAVFRAESPIIRPLHLIDLAMGADRATGVTLAPPSDPRGRSCGRPTVGGSLQPMPMSS
jgi:hypothetical protein